MPIGLLFSLHAWHGLDLSSPRSGARYRSMCDTVPLCLLLPDKPRYHIPFFAAAARLCPLQSHRLRHEPIGRTLST